jgi:hypothetical protein
MYTTKKKAELNKFGGLRPCLQKKRKEYASNIYHGVPTTVRYGTYLIDLARMLRIAENILWRRH